MPTDQTNRCHHLAMRFYREAEAPSEGTWSAVFYALLHHNEGLLRDLLEKNTTK